MHHILPIFDTTAILKLKEEYLNLAAFEDSKNEKSQNKKAEMERISQNIIDLR